jgi:hypothetical protein
MSIAGRSEPSGKPRYCASGKASRRSVRSVPVPAATHRATHQEAGDSERRTTRQPTLADPHTKRMRRAST